MVVAGEPDLTSRSRMDTWVVPLERPAGVGAASSGRADQWLGRGVDRCVGVLGHGRILPGGDDREPAGRRRRKSERRAATGEAARRRMNRTLDSTPDVYPYPVSVRTIPANSSENLADPLVGRPLTGEFLRGTRSRVPGSGDAPVRATLGAIVCTSHAVEDHRWPSRPCQRARPRPAVPSRLPAEPLRRQTRPCRPQPAPATARQRRPRTHHCSNGPCSRSSGSSWVRTG